jgi:dCMP deaminase
MNRFDISYIKMAQVWAENSHSTRNKVGALVVKDNVIISDGFNGTPTGMDNCCEDSDGNTHWYVIHAESNALMKLAKNSGSSIGSTLYVTLSPCKECSKLIIQSGIKRVVYFEDYRDTSGIDFLKANGLLVEKIVIE